MSDLSLKEALEQNRQEINGYLESLMAPTSDVPQRLWEAMSYGLLTPGKRVRPFLVREAGRLFNLEWKTVQPIAAAIEMVHAYSLIHDDMPCMDNSPMRHGRPSVHEAFDSATALLAGNGLLTLAFEHLTLQDYPPDIKLSLITHLCKASGAKGMMGGQQLDMNRIPQKSLEAIAHMQSLKTGCMLAFSCMAPAILAKASTTQIEALKFFGHHLGLAYQITDDLLDLNGEQAVVGKPLRVDGANAKITFVSILGENAARQRAHNLIEEAIETLQGTFLRASHMGDLAGYVMAREY